MRFLGVQPRALPLPRAPRGRGPGGGGTTTYSTHGKSVGRPQPDREGGVALHPPPTSSGGTGAGGGSGRVVLHCTHRRLRRAAQRLEVVQGGWCCTAPTADFVGRHRGWRWFREGGVALHPPPTSSGGTDDGGGSGRVVLHCTHRRLRRAARTPEARQPPAGAALRGRVNTKLAPPRASSSQRMVPPWASTTPRAMARPRPAPPFVRPRAPWR